MHAATKAFILKSSPVEMTEENSIREATTRRLRKNRLDKSRVLRIARRMSAVRSRHRLPFPRLPIHRVKATVPNQGSMHDPGARHCGA
jgi:hypothetical protein